MPDLLEQVGVTPLARTYGEKAEILARRFFPQPGGDLYDIIDIEFRMETYTGRIYLERRVTSEDVAKALRKLGVWKAPRND